MRTRVLWLAWLGLLALLALTAASAWWPLGPWNTVISLLVAAAKAGIVGWCFMRLRSSHSLIRITALTGIGILLLLLILSASDYGTRRLPDAPWQAPHALAPRL